METSNIKIIKSTFQKISDIVSPTMGPKGRLAVINDEFGKPILTDDGVTVAKQCLKLDGFEKMIALSMIEAAHNTESKAYDGTTLTVLLTNEIYKSGLAKIKQGVHPQRVAELIKTVANSVIKEVKYSAVKPADITETDIKNLAYLTTKIPSIGDLIASAYKIAGKNMNVVIEHERKEQDSYIEHTNGMILDEGYMSEAFKQKCDASGKYIRNNAHIILLQEGFLTPVGIRTFFSSIPEETLHDSFVFIVDKGFSPDSVKNLMDILVEAKMDFMFVVINDTKPEEVFLDLAAFTKGRVQDASFGTTDYKLEYCGIADYICIERDKTTIKITDEIKNLIEEDVARRINSYNSELENNLYSNNPIRYNTITRRIGNLTTGIVTIKVATPTITEFMTYKLKLDDAIGAVRCALKDGIIEGCGRTLYRTAFSTNNNKLKGVLWIPYTKPVKVILSNAGKPFTKCVNKLLLNSDTAGIDLKSGLMVNNLRDAGIMDSVTSIVTAIENASSIASQYIKSFIIIK